MKEGLTMQERKSVTREIQKRYKRGSKKEKGIILDEFVKLTGYNRCYASYLLRMWGKEIVIRTRGRKVVRIVGDVRKKANRKKNRLYDEEVFLALKDVWYICDCMCGKRLAPYLEEIVTKLEKHNEIVLKEKVREKLIKMSASTIDRLLSGEKKKFIIKGRSGTKPGTLIKHQIPIKTYAEWDERKGSVCRDRFSKSRWRKCKRRIYSDIRFS